MESFGILDICTELSVPKVLGFVWTLSFRSGLFSLYPLGSVQDPDTVLRKVKARPTINYPWSWFNSKDASVWKITYEAVHFPSKYGEVWGLIRMSTWLDQELCRSLVWVCQILFPDKDHWGGQIFPTLVWVGPSSAWGGVPDRMMGKWEIQLRSDPLTASSPSRGEHAVSSFRWHGTDCWYPHKLQAIRSTSSFKLQQK